MERLINKYADKIVRAGLANAENILIGGMDDELVWNRKSKETALLGELFKHLNINSILYCRPRSAMSETIRLLSRGGVGLIRPQDAETRTFLHDLPVIERLDVPSLVSALSRRKCAILPDGGVVTFGTVSPEQAFVVFSSVCFACFVKFHADLLARCRNGESIDDALDLLERLTRESEMPSSQEIALQRGPLKNDKEVHRAIIEVGRATVQLGLVDSFFGNVSFTLGKNIYISQTGSSLDELAGCIDPCPLDGSMSTGITASSELTAHLRIVELTENKAILHGHPKNAVILSLDCEESDCPSKGHCHERCDKGRSFRGIPIVPGEVGAGVHGLCHTLPEAIRGNRGAIVYGHGVFTVGRDDFVEAFEAMARIERDCRDEIFRRLGM